MSHVFSCSCCLTNYFNDTTTGLVETPNKEIMVFCFVLALSFQKILLTCVNWYRLEQLSPLLLGGRWLEDRRG